MWVMKLLHLLLLLHLQGWGHPGVRQPLPRRLMMMQGLWWRRWWVLLLLPAHVPAAMQRRRRWRVPLAGMVLRGRMGHSRSVVTEGQGSRRCWRSALHKGWGGRRRRLLLVRRVRGVCEGVVRLPLLLHGRMLLWWMVHGRLLLLRVGVVCRWLRLRRLRMHHVLMMRRRRWLLRLLLVSTCPRRLWVHACLRPLMLLLHVGVCMRWPRLLLILLLLHARVLVRRMRLHARGGRCPGRTTLVLLMLLMLLHAHVAMLRPMLTMLYCDAAVHAMRRMQVHGRRCCNAGGAVRVRTLVRLSWLRVAMLQRRLSLHRQAWARHASLRMAPHS